MFHIGVATQSPPLPDPDQLSELGIDFIEQCLTLDPSERPTAAELRHHKWMRLMAEEHVSHRRFSIPVLLSLTTSGRK